MPGGREIRSFDYVNHAYERVRDLLREEALVVFRGATKAASSRAQSVAAALHVNVGGIEVGTDIAIDVKGIEEGVTGVRADPVTHLDIEWQAAKSPGLFPLMQARLSIYPLTATETQLDFAGRYDPPFGVVGDAMDAVVGHRIAEASVHRFVRQVAEHLRTTLA